MSWQPSKILEAAVPELGGAVGRRLLSARSGRNDDRGTRLVDDLADLADAWKEATHEERNRFPRRLFVETVVANRAAVALVPRPEVRSVLEAISLRKQCMSGSDGDRRRMIELFSAHRIALAPTSDESSNLVPRRYNRYSHRSRKLSPKEIGQIQARRESQSLRSLAAEYEVSHETIRQLDRLRRTE